MYCIGKEDHRQSQGNLGLKVSEIIAKSFCKSICSINIGKYLSKKFTLKKIAAFHNDVQDIHPAR